MNFNKHFNLDGQHAFLGASKYHWINYGEDKLIDYYIRSQAVEKGKALHAFAADCIRLGQKLPKSKKTLNMYVNDAIGFGMEPEQPLYFSEFCFGTADTIAFNERKKFLRIHDLKTGQNPGHMEQLEIYAALFCLEYRYKPHEIETELRLYQNDEILVNNPDPDYIYEIVNKAIEFDKILKQFKSKGV